MNEAKIAHLNALGFVWTLRESKKPWEEWMTELRAYKKMNGHVDVPLKYEKSLPLGAFVNNQRSEYRKLRRGEPSSMTDEKIKELESMGFHWSVRESRTPWTSRLKELKAYKEKFGDVHVPRNWKDNPSLSYWVDKVCFIAITWKWCLLYVSYSYTLFSSLGGFSSWHNISNENNTKSLAKGLVI